jgi:Flp pilus assembly protein TadG
VLLVGALLLGLAFVGLAVDGARLFTARRDLQNVADSAALAGASAIDEAAFRASEGVTVRLDPDRARAAAEQVVWAARLPAGTTVEVRATSERVEVRIRRPVATTFLRIVGVRTQEIGATAHASPRTA